MLSTPQPSIHLVLGGTRSGKSLFAEQTAVALASARASTGESGAMPASAPITYIATAQIFDDEMRERVTKHVARRGSRWRTHEVPVELANAIAAADAPGETILVDCLSVWLGNLFHHDINIDVAFQDLLKCLPSVGGNLVLVAAEVGLGIVPETSLGRAYRDRAGELNQLIAAHADHVTLVVAGLPMTVKSPS
jgi:adenosylcobinamide kinase / adenosylcobinamide-phosphate guanylyltransferase